MKQTPAFDVYNPDLLRFMDRAFETVVEVGCSSGALARVYRERYPEVRYLGVEIEPERAQMARQFCNLVVCSDIESLPGPEWDALFPSDCWVFGDTLEHMKDPWAVLARVRARISPAGRVVACIPNAQHWSVQVRLATGLFRYEDLGLLDRTHLRWFTRVTMTEMFQSAGFAVSGMFPRIFDEPAKDSFLPSIRSLAVAAGADPESAARDSLPLQYVILASPI